MFGAKATTTTDIKKVTKAVDKGAFRSFSHAAARIRKTAAESIVKSKEPSRPGAPPTTRKKRSHNLPFAIRFAANKEGAVIGPRHSVVGTSGEAHEKGGEYEGDQFEQRPFMEPALLSNTDRMLKDWEGSIT